MLRTGSKLSFVQLVLRLTIIDIHSGEIVISGNVSDDGYSLQSAAQQVGEELAKKLQKLMKSKK